ncbi:MAG: cytochrome c oxidase subunit 3 [Hahellaceae bacterium]|nr:cytochrome c oxidase subunit 3 [Hahellaceae bacterium]
MATLHAAKHEHYYVPAQSKWPIIATVGLTVTMLGAGSILNAGSAGKSTSMPWVLFLIGASIMAYMLFGWFGNVIRESRGGLYSPQADRSFRWGMSWFIFSEVMFFAAFFGALFYARNFAVPWLGGEGGKGISAMLWPEFQAVWPLLQNPDPGKFPGPQQIIDPWHIPLLNTVLLVSSSVTVTLAHKALKQGKRGAIKLWLACTVALGVVFLFFQAEEYVTAYEHYDLTLQSGIYGSTFFMLTGFHGAHVTLGALMLSIMLIRIIKGHFDEKHHFGFEAASWYWHFVDVVWLGLFLFVYVL